MTPAELAAFQAASRGLPPPPKVLVAPGGKTAEDVGKAERSLVQREYLDTQREMTGKPVAQVQATTLARAEEAVPEAVAAVPDPIPPAELGVGEALARAWEGPTHGIMSDLDPVTRAFVNVTGFTPDWASAKQGVPNTLSETKQSLAYTQIGNALVNPTSSLPERAGSMLSGLSSLAAEAGADTTKSDAHGKKGLIGEAPGRLLGPDDKTLSPGESSYIVNGKRYAGESGPQQVLRLANVIAQPAMTAGHDLLASKYSPLQIVEDKNQDGILQADEYRPLLGGEGELAQRGEVPRTHTGVVEKTSSWAPLLNAPGDFTIRVLQDLEQGYSTTPMGAEAAINLGLHPEDPEYKFLQAVGFMFEFANWEKGPAALLSKAGDVGHAALSGARAGINLPSGQSAATSLRAAVSEFFERGGSIDASKPLDMFHRTHLGDGASVDDLLPKGTLQRQALDRICMTMYGMTADELQAARNVTGAVVPAAAQMPGAVGPRPAPLPQGPQPGPVRPARPPGATPPKSMGWPAVPPDTATVRIDPDAAMGADLTRPGDGPAQLDEVTGTVRPKAGGFPGLVEDAPTWMDVEDKTAELTYPGGFAPQDATQVGGKTDAPRKGLAGFESMVPDHWREVDLLEELPPNQVEDITQMDTTKELVRFVDDLWGDVTGRGPVGGASTRGGFESMPSEHQRFRGEFPRDVAVSADIPRTATNAEKPVRPVGLPITPPQPLPEHPFAAPGKLLALVNSAGPDAAAFDEVLTVAASASDHAQSPMASALAAIDLAWEAARNLPETQRAAALDLLTIADARSSVAEVATAVGRYGLYLGRPTVAPELAMDLVDSVRAGTVSNVEASQTIVRLASAGPEITAHATAYRQGLDSMVEAAQAAPTARDRRELARSYQDAASSLTRRQLITAAVRDAEAKAARGEPISPVQQSLVDEFNRHKAEEAERRKLTNQAKQAAKRGEPGPYVPRAREAGPATKARAKGGAEMVGRTYDKDLVPNERYAGSRDVAVRVMEPDVADVVGVKYRIMDPGGNLRGKPLDLNSATEKLLDKYRQRGWSVVVWGSNRPVAKWRVEGVSVGGKVDLHPDWVGASPAEAMAVRDLLGARAVDKATSQGALSQEEALREWLVNEYGFFGGVEALLPGMIDVAKMALARGTPESFDDPATEALALAMNEASKAMLRSGMGDSRVVAVAPGVYVTPLEFRRLHADPEVDALRRNVQGTGGAPGIIEPRDRMAWWNLHMKYGGKPPTSVLDPITSKANVELAQKIITSRAGHGAFSANAVRNMAPWGWVASRVLERISEHPREWFLSHGSEHAESLLDSAFNVPWAKLPTKTQDALRPWRFRLSNVSNEVGQALHKVRRRGLAGDNVEAIHQVLGGYWKPLTPQVNDLLELVQTPGLSAQFNKTAAQEILKLEGAILDPKLVAGLHAGDVTAIREWSTMRGAERDRIALLWLKAHAPGLSPEQINKAAEAYGGGLAGLYSDTFIHGDMRESFTDGNWAGEVKWWENYQGRVQAPRSPIRAALGEAHGGKFSAEEEDQVMLRFAMLVKSDHIARDAAQDLIAKGLGIEKGSILAPIVDALLRDVPLPPETIAADVIEAERFMERSGLKAGSSAPLESMFSEGFFAKEVAKQLGEARSFGGLTDKAQVFSSKTLDNAYRLLKESMMGRMFPFIAAPHFLSNAVGGVTQVFLQEGFRGVGAMASGAVDPKVWELTGRLGNYRARRWRGIPGNKQLRSMFAGGYRRVSGQWFETPNGPLHINDVEDMARTFGLDASVARNESASDLVEDLRAWDAGAWKRVTSYNQWQQSVVQLDHIIETSFRMSVFVDHLKGGAPPAQAAEAAKQAMYDASNLTPFERTRMRAIFPFYTFKRKNLEAIITALFAHPARIAYMLRAMENQSDVWGLSETQKHAKTPKDWSNLTLYIDRDNTDENGTPDPLTSGTQYVTTAMAVPDDLMFLATMLGMTDDGRMESIAQMAGPHYQIAYQTISDMTMTGMPLDRDKANEIPRWMNDPEQAFDPNTSPMFDPNNPGVGSLREPLSYILPEWAMIDPSMSGLMRYYFGAGQEFVPESEVRGGELTDSSGRAIRYVAGKAYQDDPEAAAMARYKWMLVKNLAGRPLDVVRRAMAVVDPSTRAPGVDLPGAAAELVGGVTAKPLGSDYALEARQNADRVRSLNEKKSYVGPAVTPGPL